MKDKDFHTWEKDELEAYAWELEKRIDDCVTPDNNFPGVKEYYEMIDELSLVTEELEKRADEVENE